MGLFDKSQFIEKTNNADRADRADEGGDRRGKEAAESRGDPSCPIKIHAARNKEIGKNASLDLRSREARYIRMRHRR